MSYIESLLNENKRINVSCQTDNEYKISSNQCSWCAALFGLNYEELIRSFFASNKDKFLKIYHNCLKEGSELRRDNNKYLYGENIDSENLFEQLNMSKRIVANFSYLSGTDNDFIKILPDDLKNEFYTRIHVPINNLSVIKSYKFCLISRHGQSFTVIPIGDSFLVLDSHVHTIGLMNYDNVVKYIKYQSVSNSESDSETDGHLHVTILCGI
jgi:hypothetical protein